MICAGKMRGEATGRWGKCARLAAKKAPLRLYVA
jgi:hypothetical protein